MNVKEYYNYHHQGFNSYSDSKEQTLNIFDLDHTLGKQDNTFIRIKKVSMDTTTLRENLDSVVPTEYFQMVINDDNVLSSIQKSEEVYIINPINKPLKKHFKHSADYIEITQHYTLDDIIENQIALKSILNQFESNYTFTIYDENNQKEYVSIDTLLSLKPSNTNIKLDLKCYSQLEYDLFKPFLNNTHTIHSVGIINGKNFNEDMKEEHTRLMTKKFISKDELLSMIEMGENIFESCDSVVQLDIYDSITYNYYEKKPTDILANYGDFRCATAFSKNTIFFEEVKKKLLEHYENGEICVIITARGKLKYDNGNDDIAKQMTIDMFNANGIPLGSLEDKKIHLFFSGYFDTNVVDFSIKPEIQEQETVMKKLVFIHEILTNNPQISKVRMYEDNKFMINGLVDYMKENQEEKLVENHLIVKQKPNLYEPELPTPIEIN